MRARCLRYGRSLVAQVSGFLYRVSHHAWTLLIFTLKRRQTSRQRDICLAVRNSVQRILTYPVDGGCHGGSLIYINGNCLRLRLRLRDSARTLSVCAVFRDNWAGNRVRNAIAADVLVYNLHLSLLR